MAPLTSPGDTRKKVYRFVRSRILAGQSPTVREVQEAFGFRAVQSARQHLEALVAEGLLRKPAPRRSRGYRLPGTVRNTPAGSGQNWIPLVGRVQAGALTAALEDPEGYLAVHEPGGGKDRGELFALRVRGQSMRNAGILDGDVVVVQRRNTADTGDIVVALVGDEATVKRLKIRRGKIQLHPENEAFSPITPDPEELTILGKVVEVRRYLEGSGPPLAEPGENGDFTP